MNKGQEGNIQKEDDSSIPRLHRRPRDQSRDVALDIVSESLDSSSATTSLLGSSVATVTTSHMDSSVSRSSSSTRISSKKKRKDDDEIIEIPRDEKSSSFSNFSNSAVSVQLSLALKALKILNEQGEQINFHDQAAWKKREEERRQGRTCGQSCREKGVFVAAFFFIGTAIGTGITAAVINGRVPKPYVLESTGDQRFADVTEFINETNTFAKTTLPMIGLCVVLAGLFISLFGAYLVQRFTTQDRVKGDKDNSERSDRHEDYTFKGTAAMDQMQKLTTQVLEENIALKQDMIQIKKHLGIFEEKKRESGTPVTPLSSSAVSQSETGAYSSSTVFKPGDDEKSLHRSPTPEASEGRDEEVSDQYSFLPGSPRTGDKGYSSSSSTSSSSSATSSSYSYGSGS